MSLYRTYRPQAFADVIGQDHIVTTLEQASAQDKLAHAYLFAGNRGTGKTSVARILAKIMMTQKIKDEKIKSQIEKGVEEGSIVDLLEIDAASNRGIDDIRDLIEKIQFSPVVASAKVYIIDEVHMLTKEAFNALLKTLEEPPPYAFFILATTELNKIPTTIQSRCQCFPFRNIRDEDIIRRLQFIADNEKIDIERDALRDIARHVDGGMRDAISLLDQLRSLEKIGLEDVKQHIGSTGHEYIETVFQAIDNQDAKTLVSTIQTIEENGIPMDVFLRQLLGIIRNKIHEAVEKKESIVALIAIMDTLLAAIRDVRIAPLPGLVLESALLSLCAGEADASKQPKLASDEEKPVKKEEASSLAKTTDDKKEEKEKKDSKDKKKSLDSSASSESSEEKKEVTESELEDAIVEATELSLETIREQWPEILTQTDPPSVRMSLKDGRIENVEDSTVILSFSSAFHRDKVADTEASRKIEQVMGKIFKQSLRLKCIIEQHGPSEKTKSEDAVNLADAAAEIF